MISSAMRMCTQLPLTAVGPILLFWCLRYDDDDDDDSDDDDDDVLLMSVLHRILVTVIDGENVECSAYLLGL